MGMKGWRETASLASGSRPSRPGSQTVRVTGRVCQWKNREDQRQNARGRRFISHSSRLCVSAVSTINSDRAAHGSTLVASDS